MFCHVSQPHNHLGIIDSSRSTLLETATDKVFNPCTHFGEQLPLFGTLVAVLGFEFVPVTNTESCTHGAHVVRTEHPTLRILVDVAIPASYLRGDLKFFRQRIPVSEAQVLDKSSSQSLRCPHGSLPTESKNLFPAVVYHFFLYCITQFIHICFCFNYLIFIL